MPLGDVTYQNAALDAVVASWPASGATYRWWTSDPQLQDDPTDVEVDLSVAGLTNPAFDPADWAAAADGAITTTAPITIGTSTDALTDVGAYWGVVDSGGLIVYSDDLPDDDVLEVDEAGTDAEFSPVLTFGAA